MLSVKLLFLIFLLGLDMRKPVIVTIVIPKNNAKTIPINILISGTVD